MITCYRCRPMRKPQVIVVEKPLGGELCEGCGNALVDIVEILDVPHIDKEKPDKPDKPEKPEEPEEPESAGEIVEVMEAPPPLDITSEDVDMMTTGELLELASNLGLGDLEGNLKTDIQNKLKTVLAK